MRRKKTTLYDAHEKRILEQTSAFAEFFTKKGTIGDHNIEDEKVRRIRQAAAKKAYHNTEVLLEQYKTIVWIIVLNCSVEGSAERTEVYVVSEKDFVKWYEASKSFPNEGVKLRARTSFLA